MSSEERPDTEATEAPGTEDVETFLEETQAEAVKGSVDHQLFLGRHFLKLARANDRPTQNGRKGVDWLVTASQNGSTEATELLRQCLKEKIGVGEGNVAMVQECLKTSDLDKSIRTAARMLYREIRPPDISEFQKESYSARVKELIPERRERRFLLSTAHKIDSDNIIEEKEFVNTQLRRMQAGQIDPSQDEAEMEAFAEASFQRKILKYPGTSITMVTDGLIEFLTTDAVNLLMYLLPIDQINLLIAFFLLSLLSFAWLFSISTLVLCYGSFSIMVICTAQMFQNRRKQLEVRAMARMLKRYDSKLDIGTTETVFIRNSLRPYWTFFGSLFVFVLCFYLTNKHWVPCSEFALVSVLLALASIVLLSKHSDPIVMLSLGFDILSCLPQLLAGFPEIPIVTHGVAFLTKPLYSLKVFPSFYLNLSIPALEYAILPLLFIRLAYKNKWQGVYSVLLPHFVGFFWIQVAVLYFDYSTWLGLARGSMGWAAFVVLMPFITLAGSVYGVYHMIVTFSLASLMKVAVTILLLLTPVLLSVWKGYGFSMGSLSLRGKSLKMKLAVIFVPLLIAAPLGYLVMGDFESPEDVTFLPWSHYRDQCGQPAWDKSNMAAAQRACDHFKFMEVNWTGTVQTVNIADMRNPADAFLDQFPDVVGEGLKCIYGSRYKPCNQTTMTSVEYDMCLIRVKYGRQCHMKDRRTYTFLLTVDMPLEDGRSQSVPITASDDFKGILFQLEKGDEVMFHAVLQGRLGSAIPNIKLEGIRCTSCRLTTTKVKSTTVDPSKAVMNAFLETISFYTSPLLDYAPPTRR